MNERADGYEMERSLGIPPIFWGATLDAKQTKAVEAAKAYIESEEEYGAGHALALLGNTGAGKTYAAMAALRTIRYQHHEVARFEALPWERDSEKQDRAWSEHCDAKKRLPRVCRRVVPFADLVSMPFGDERDELHLVARGAGLVVIDDVGAEYRKAGGERMSDALLDEIVSLREAHLLPTIITSNLMPVDFKKYAGDRVASRLNGGWCRVVVAHGSDLREGRTRA